jgi:hypothetical protein
LPQELLPRVLLVDEDLDNKASKWFTVDVEIVVVPVEIKGQLDSKFKLEVHNDAPEKFCERFPPILGSGHKDCSFQTALQAATRSIGDGLNVGKNQSTIVPSANP